MRHWAAGAAAEAGVAGIAVAVGAVVGCAVLPVVGATTPVAVTPSAVLRAGPGAAICTRPGNWLRSSPSTTRTMTAPPTNTNLPRGFSQTRSTRVTNEMLAPLGAASTATGR